MHNHAFSGLFLTDISDHFPVFTIISEQAKCHNKKPYFFVRDRNRSNMDKFNDVLRNVTWSNIPGYNDPRYAYSVFLDKYTDIYNFCFPLKKIKNTKNKTRKPWLSKGLLKSIKRKGKLYKYFLNYPSPANENTYKRFKNKLTHLLRIAKRKFYENQLKCAETNTKNTWKILNEVINRKKESNKLPSDFFVNNRNVSNPREIANHFCEYFTNIGPNLSNSVDCSSRRFSSYLTGNMINSMHLKLVTDIEVKEIINNLCCGTSSGYDQIPM